MGLLRSGSIEWLNYGCLDEWIKLLLEIKVLFSNHHKSNLKVREIETASPQLFLTHMHHEPCLCWKWDNPVTWPSHSKLTCASLLLASLLAPWRKKYLIIVCPTTCLTDEWFPIAMIHGRLENLKFLLLLSWLTSLLQRNLLLVLSLRRNLAKGFEIVIRNYLSFGKKKMEGFE